MNPDSKQFLSEASKWLGIYFPIAATISILVLITYSLVILIGVIMGLAYHRRKKLMRKMGATSGTFFGGVFGQEGVDYHCLNCGTKHNQLACPNCGSKMKKAGF
ncbi:MAG TPA: hypothetical protein VGQ03_02470 [Nitrososphaera sp.]|nr:hypothetical protein [Nitrososphaera sp.]